jgi:argininosuccinate lyase
MPQKKNPDVLELVRGKTGQVLGHMMDLLITLKGLPMTYDRDLQEDKRGLFASLETVKGVLEVLPPLVAKVDADEAAARAGLEKGFSLTLATDVAEYLVVNGLPFRDAHWKVGKLAKYCLEEKKHLTALSLAEWQAQIPEVRPDIFDILSLEKSVARRNTYGGTAFTQVAVQIGQGQERLLEKAKALEDQRERLESCACQS